MGPPLKVGRLLHNIAEVHRGYVHIVSVHYLESAAATAHSLYNVTLML